MKIEDYASCRNEGANLLGYPMEKKSFLKELAELTGKISELRMKNKELNYRNEIQKKMISILAHEVRSPLASIKNIIEFKRSDILDANDSAEMMDIVSSQLNNTLELVDNVVHWGKLHLQFGRLLVKDFDINELVERIFVSESLNSIAKNNKLVHNIRLGTIIHSDQQALEFILRNLISNANKFTENGSITVSMRQQDSKIILWVTDTGVGMPEEQADELLNNNTFKTTLGTNKEKGSGLGLLLVKEFVERLNGTITVKSAVNKGTSFKIVI